MSSVVIAGNTSGSITLSAPATAGTNTITLPAETGTLVTSATTSGISGSAITTGTVGVSVGGTGITTTTAYGILAGGTTSTGAFQNAGVGTSGQVLTSNGPGVLPSFQALPASGGQQKAQLFTAPGTFTTPSIVTSLKITVIGGGGGSTPGSPTGAGLGGLAIGYCPVTASTPYSVTVGAGGNPPGTGGTSSFGSLISATGGGGAANPGTGTVTTGTTLIQSDMKNATQTVNAVNSSGLNAVYSYVTYGNTLRAIAPGGTPGTPYTIGGGYIAGAGGGYLNGQPNPITGGVGGLVLVEYVG